jgi:ankyrin repeat protein
MCNGQSLQNTLASMPIAAAPSPSANTSGKGKRSQNSAENNAAAQLRAMGISPAQYSAAICKASDSSDNEKLALLIAAGADVNAYSDDDGYTPLTNVCVRGNTEGLRLLLTDPGIEVNKPNTTGDTAIIFVAIRGHVENLRMLMAVPGIDINFIDSDNKTALDWATENGHTECVNMLREAGAKSVRELR